MEIFDTHAHLNWREEYKDDIDAVLDNAKKAGVTHILLASSTIKDSGISLDVRSAKSGSGVKLSCMVGVHPEDATSFNEEAKWQLEQWLKNKDELGIVAVGEIGMDYHYDDRSPAFEAMAFIYQMGLAYRYDLPAVIHERDACEDTLFILKSLYDQHLLREAPGVLHCFSGSVETAKILLDMGFYLGFDGPITFKNARKAPDVIRMCPLDRLLVETDSPYMAPVPHRGHRNEPAYVKYVVEEMARLKEISAEEMARITTENAQRLFGKDT
ncbi:MAG: TatD family hydrolase [Clostridiales bacterium]|nr:TatD family hydrolase [Clostridiales bacterium]